MKQRGREIEREIEREKERGERVREIKVVRVSAG